jgi:hypothetical protein
VKSRPAARRVPVALSAPGRVRETAESLSVAHTKSYAEMALDVVNG